MSTPVPIRLVGPVAGIDQAAADGDGLAYDGTSGTWRRDTVTRAQLTTLDARVSAIEQAAGGALKGYGSTGRLGLTFGPFGNSGPWVMCPPAYRATTTAAVDDVVEWIPELLVNLGADSEHDLAAIVGGQPVRYASSGTSVGHLNGHGGMYLSRSGQFATSFPSMVWHVQAGDLDNGTLTLALMYRDTGSGNTIGSAAYPSSIISLLNWGPVTAAGEDLTGRVTALENARGAPNGIATLDSAGQVPYSQLPEELRPEVTTDLSAWLTTYTTSISAAQPYREPTPAEATDAVTGLERLAVDGADAQALLTPMGFTLSSGYDSVSRRPYVMAEAETTGDRRWGAYLVDLSEPVTLLIEAPHPVADTLSEDLALRHWQNTPGAMLMISGSHRNAAADLGDVAHQVGSLFHHVAASAASRSLPQVQWHGFADATAPGLTHVIASGDAEVGSTVKRVASEMATVNGFVVGRGWDSSGSETGLTGTDNAQGDDAAAKGTTFVHVETNATTRATETGRALTAAAVVAAAPQAAALADGGAVLAASVTGQDPRPVGSVNTVGTSNVAARSDHIHQERPATVARIDALEAARGAANGVAPLGADSKVPVAYLPVGTGTETVAAGAHTHAQADVTGLPADLAARQLLAEKDQPSGYAGLSATSKLDGAQQLYATQASSIQPVGNAASVGTLDSAARSDHVHAGVALSGDQTIAGTKTFSSPPVVPDPTAAGHAVNRTYADTKLSAATRGAPNGVASLDATGLVPVAQIPTGTSATTVAVGNHTHAFTALTGLDLSAVAAGDVLAYNGSAWANSNRVAILELLVPSEPTDNQHYGDVVSSIRRNRATNQATLDNGYWTFSTVMSPKTFTATKIRFYVAAAGVAGGSPSAAVVLYDNGTQVATTTVSATTFTTAGVKEFTLSASVNVVAGRRYTWLSYVAPASFTTSPGLGFTAVYYNALNNPGAALTYNGYKAAAAAPPASINTGDGTWTGNPSTLWWALL